MYINKDGSLLGGKYDGINIVDVPGYYIEFLRKNNHRFSISYDNYCQDNNIYKDYLNSNNWQEKRKEIIKRDEKCRCCGCTDNLQIHHLTYENLMNEKTRQLITLCRGCHELETKMVDNMFNGLYNKYESYYTIIKDTNLYFKKGKKRFDIFRYNWSELFKPLFDYMNTINYIDEDALIEFGEKYKLTYSYKPTQDVDYKKLRKYLREIKETIQPKCDSNVNLFRLFKFKFAKEVNKIIGDKVISIRTKAYGDENDFVVG